jgi:hypothetical protein
VTIRKGEPWGGVGPLPAGLVQVRTDRELGELVTETRLADRPLPPVGLLGGDLMRAVGGTGDPMRFVPGREVTVLPVDVIRVEIDGERRWAATHVVVRGDGSLGWWRGETIAAMNGQYLGTWDVAPRAHPNDGRVDVVRVDPAMSLRDRWRARGRLPHAMHLPHPSITVRSVATIDVDLARPAGVHLDGARWLEAQRVRLTIEPDALMVCI